MAALVTGASGFLGKALVERLLKRGDKVYGLSRHPPEAQGNLVPLIGDIMEPNLGLDIVPEGVGSIHHLAASHRLGEDKHGDIWSTNVNGTRNVINFCINRGIEKLYFCSTAYTQGRNDYEKSKAVCELMVRESDIKYQIIFKPSIIMGTPQHIYLGHFCQFANIMIKVHQRAELVRRKVEETMRLPAIEPVFRVKGNPEGKLNIVSIDDVADAMVRIHKPGTYWLTHSHPPTLKQVADWIGEFIMVSFKFVPDFKPMPLEALFAKMGAAFLPYCQGDDFHSDLPNCPPITKQFIHDNLIRTLLT